MANNQLLKTFWLLCIYPVYSLLSGFDITIIFSGTSNFSISPFTKNIVYIHDLGELFIKFKYDKKRVLYRKYLTLPINKRFGDLFISVSGSVQQAIIEKLKIDEQKVRLIYNGADKTVSTLDKGTARDEIVHTYKINDTDRIIITVGRIDPVGKNLIKLVEAVSVLRETCQDFHLFLVGDSNFSNSFLVPEEIEKRDLHSYITLTGYVDAEMLGMFYKASDLLVFPSVHEGFGLPLLEAMNNDLPVACSDIEVFHEVAADAALYFDPSDANDIAAKVDIALNDKTARERLIENGRYRQSCFSWEKSANELMAILREVSAQK